MQLEMCLSSSLSKSKVNWSINEPVYTSWGFDDDCD